MVDASFLLQSSLTTKSTRLALAPWLALRNPTLPQITHEFLELSEEEPVLAVHCRAGLGRTGTLIGVWMMTHAGFTAMEAIGWLRIVRPGR